MTLIFDSYYESISNGTIDLNNVDFGVILVTKEYNPDAKHLFSDIVPFVHKIDSVLLNNDIVSLSMSEIVSKIETLVTDEQKQIVVAFITYDTSSNTLCFYENFETRLWQQDTGY